MKRAEAIPVEVQKRETLKTLKQSTRPKEQRQQGAVKFGIYKNYIKANGYIGVGFFVFFLWESLAEDALLGDAVPYHDCGPASPANRYQRLVEELESEEPRKRQQRKPAILSRCLRRLWSRCKHHVP